MAPYRVLGDMNMPGALLVEWIVMHTLGGGDIAWRVFDFGSLAVAAGAMLYIARPYDWFSGVFAASLFALVHGRDGLAQPGQRDLTMAVVLVLATAFLFCAVRRERVWAAGLFGLCAGVAATIKPTALPFGVVLFVIATMEIRRRGRPIRWYIIASSLSFLFAPLAALAFLHHEHATAAFLQGLRTVVPYYSSLGHRPFVFLLLHSISPLLPLVLTWLVMLCIGWPRLDWERTALSMGAALGLASYLLQPRGFPYYRYPFLAFLLPLMAIDFVSAVKSLAGRHPKLRRTLATAALAIGSLFIAPVSAIYIHQYEWRNIEFISSVEENIDRLGGSSLSGHIQCIDSISGCGTALYRSRLVQSTGVLSDFLLFGPDQTPIVRQTREQFLGEITSNPPKVIVVSSWLHIDGPDNYEKLDRWPAFKNYLQSNYLLDTDWRPRQPVKWWSREEWPKGYRIYVRKDLP